ncbi:MAG: hypothetical protein ABSF95_21105 [Verrucomicrobiota bacterium]|jgi:hypothetical protein
MLSREQRFRLLGIPAGVAAVVLSAFALTMPYSSIGHRGIASELSSPGATDTRLFIAVFLATVLAIAAVPRQPSTTPGALKKFALTLFMGLLAFVVMNAASFFVRGGSMVCAYGFPFVFRKWGGPPNVIMDSFDHPAMWADIVVAVFVSTLLGTAQFRVLRRTSRLKRVAFILSLALVAYVGVFSYWWMTSKRMSVTENGRQLRQVELHQSEVMYLTQPMWDPAFWFMERVCGYRYLGYIAAMEDSAFCYEK